MLLFLKAYDLFTPDAYSDPNIDCEVKFFDLKVLFILTAVCPNSRNNLRKHLNVLVEYLDYILKEAAQNHIENSDLPPIYLNVSKKLLIILVVIRFF